MLAKRIIPCLDIKEGRVVKGTSFLNLRDAGNPLELAQRYNDQSADELVFLDITADWCATCQYNKINVIKSTEIQNAFSKFNVVKVRGDWSKPNENILKYLNENGRYGIPFNIIYTKINPEGIPLSELLSNKEIIEILTK